MSLKILDTPTMVTITEDWLDPERTRPALEAIPQTKALLPDLDEALQNLLKIQVWLAAVSEAVKILTDQLTAMDQRHDRKLRGLYLTLWGLSEMADDEARAEALLTLRDTLFPKGLAGINASYRSSAGEVKLATERLSDDDRSALAAIPIENQTLMTQVDLWVSFGEQLGLLENQRVNAQNESNSEGFTPADVLKARNRWIRVVRALETNFNLSDATEAQRLKVFGAMQDAIKKARPTSDPQT